MLPLILKTDIRQRTISQLTTDELQSLKQAIMSLQIIDVDNVHESFLPWLAWQWRVESWSDDWPVEQRRAVVKEALLMFRYKGTPWAVTRSLSLLNFDVTLLEWHQIPNGVNGRFLLNINQRVDNPLNNNDYLNIFKSVERNKRGSQHWGMVVKNPPCDGGAYAACTTRSRHRVIARNYPENPKFTFNACTAVFMKSRHRVVISNKD